MRTELIAGSDIPQMLSASAQVGAREAGSRRLVSLVEPNTVKFPEMGWIRPGRWHGQRVPVIREGVPGEPGLLGMLAEDWRSAERRRR